MIVVDTNVISYLMIPGVFTPLAERAARMDQWCAPLLWRSEFRNVATMYFRRNLMSLEDARRQTEAAERLLWGREFSVRSSAVFDCVSRSERSAYDCEFVALAIELGIRLITTDEPIVSEFPSVAVHLRDYAK